MSEPGRRDGEPGRGTTRKPANDSTNDERRLDDGINYSLEGSAPPRHDEKRDPTAAGYDEAAHSGPSMYGVPEGEGGVFGTSGGGTYSGGGQVIERPGVYDRSGEPEKSESQGERHTGHRELDRYDSVNTEDNEDR